MSDGPSLFLVLHRHTRRSPALIGITSVRRAHWRHSHPAGCGPATWPRQRKRHIRPQPDRGPRPRRRSTYIQASTGPSAILPHTYRIRQEGEALARRSRRCARSIRSVRCTPLVVVPRGRSRACALARSPSAELLTSLWRARTRAHARAARGDSYRNAAPHSAASSTGIGWVDTMAVPWPSIVSYCTRLQSVFQCSFSSSRTLTNTS